MKRIVAVIVMILCSTGLIVYTFGSEQRKEDSKSSTIRQLPDGSYYEDYSDFDFPTDDELFAKWYRGVIIKDDTQRIPELTKYSTNMLIHNMELKAVVPGRDATRLLNSSISWSWIELVSKVCPCEAIRERNDGSRYVIYDTDDGSRLFLLVNTESPINIIGFPIIVRNRLQYSDFSDLSIGDTLSKVESIDDIIVVYRDDWDVRQPYKTLEEFDYISKNHPLESLHYLSDGLLEIKYGTMNEQGELTVSEMNYYPDYKIVSIYFDRVLDYTINPLDLP